MKQSTALQILKQGYCVFLTGQAGAGKTYLLNQYIDYLRKHHIFVAVTASTGIAATHMNGMTIHAWAGIGIKTRFDKQDFTTLSQRTAVVERLKSVKVLIIDEVSMLHAHQLDLVDEVLRTIRSDHRPFGGVQVVFAGDFFQLPPIGQKQQSTKEKFAFMSKAWIELATNKTQGSPAIKVCYLSEQHRQIEDTPTQQGNLTLNDILNQIRTQTLSQEAIHTLLATKDNNVLPHRTRLYTHNINVDDTNEKELAQLTDPPYEFYATEMGDPNLLEALKKNVRTTAVLTLKKGSKVMFVKNNPVHDYCNGSMGEVIDFYDEDESGESLPVVKLNDGRTLVVEPETWSIDDAQGEALASFSQIPLCLAWAITIHKSQGMTLDAAEIDLSSAFELGQGYVALSRVKSLSGLKLLGMNQKSLRLDEFAQLANRRFLTLSKECEEWFEQQTSQQIEARQNEFLDASKHNPFASSTTNTQAALPSFDPKLLTSGMTLHTLSRYTRLSTSTLLTHIENQLSTQALKPDDLHHLFDPTILQTLQDASPDDLQNREQLSNIDDHTINLFLLIQKYHKKDLP